MLRRSPLARGDKPLGRRTGLAQVGRRRREEAEATGSAVRATLTAKYRPAVPDDVRAELKKRSGGQCEMALPGCTRVATDACHRITRKMGGRRGDAQEFHNRLSDLLDGCRTCHTWQGARPEEAYELGLSLKEHQIPTQEPVVRRGELVYLTDDGRVVPFDEVGC